MNKKIIALLLAIVMIVGVVSACGSSANTEQETAAETEAPAEGEETAEASEGNAALNIVIVSSPSGVDDGSFNQDNYIGIQNFIANYPDSKVEDIKETDEANAVPTASSVVGDYDVIVTPGFQFAGISQAAVDNPDKKFILVDAFPVDVAAGEGEAEYENIYAMQFKEQEGGFLAGVAAALETKSGKVAVVNGIAYPSNVNYQYGFEAGVAYAVKHLGATAEVVELAQYAGTDVTGADVGGNYIGDFADQATGKVVGEALLAEGVDIMLVAAGGAGNGVFTAVKENGNALVIGCDVDQYDDGANGDSNIILTSALKVMHLNVERQLEEIANGTFVGKNELLGADSDSVSYVSEEGRNQLSDETKTELDKVLEGLKDGSIVPPSNFSEETVESFPGL